MGEKTFNKACRCCCELSRWRAVRRPNIVFTITIDKEKNTDTQTKHTTQSIFIKADKYYVS